MSSVLISTSLVLALVPVPVSVGEELEAVLFEALLGFSVLLTLSPPDDNDGSLDFLSVLLVIGVVVVADGIVVVVVVDDVDVELKSVFVLSLSDFVLSLDLASSVTYVNKRKCITQHNTIGQIIVIDIGS